MATNFLLATTLKYLGAKRLPEKKVNFMPWSATRKNAKKLAFHIINVSKSKDLLQVKFKKLILFKTGCVISPTTFQTIWETVLAIF